MVLRQGLRGMESYGLSWAVFDTLEKRIETVGDEMITLKQIEELEVEYFYCSKRCANKGKEERQKQK